MSTNHTPNYALSQWQASDQVLRTDFNEDNAKIDAALRRHNNQLLGVPALGRNLYNFFLQQKQAGQNVSWISGLVYDDFSDQSKIESMEQYLSWSSSEKCIVFNTSQEEECQAALVTKELPLNLRHSCGMVLMRDDILFYPKVEIWDVSGQTWVELQKIDDFRRITTGQPSIYEIAYFVPKQFSTNVKLRITLRERYYGGKTFHLYDYCYMAF